MIDEEQATGQHGEGSKAAPLVTAREYRYILGFQLWECDRIW